MSDWLLLPAVWLLAGIAVLFLILIAMVENGPPPNGAGCYVVRCRRPGLLGALNWPIISRHIAYVGESMHMAARRGQHLKGSARYGSVRQPWSDLKPKFYYISLPSVRKLTLAVETLLILVLFPVYNYKKNLANPRRIPLAAAKRQALQRAFTGGVWSFNLRFGHMILWLIAGVVFVAWRRHAGSAPW